ncbi:MAG: glycosyltransferase family 2 protein [Candidatus Faecisoma sp.]|nr:glycosyltransferase family 2 protein [Acholeplasma sp.]MDY2893068.1 glycosyltransferase family 2 protein [Candidatus Faecisoma sp.]
MTVCFILITIGIIWLLIDYILSYFNSNVPKGKNNKGKFAILIPARDESRVIEELLNSILNQTRKIDSDDVYVIVEEESDKTVELVKNKNMNIVFRHDLSKKRKGYALDDAIKEILEQKKHYDAYFIFDADNVLDKDYIKNMEEAYEDGYDIGIGYRNTKNGNDSVIAAASSLTFSMINTLGNEHKTKCNNTLTISGTGFYIKGDIVEKLSGYPFNSLTEDYELTLYATLNDLTTTYVKNAIFFDEQPVKYNITINQRTRWIKGFFEARKKYIPLLLKKEINKNFSSSFHQIMGVTPYILLIIGLLGILLINYFNVKNTIILILFVYLIMVLITSIMVLKEKSYLNINNKMKIKVILYNPIFLTTYIICLFKAILNKDVKWLKIEHSKSLDTSV